MHYTVLIYTARATPTIIAANFYFEFMNLWVGMSRWTSFIQSVTAAQINNEQQLNNEINFVSSLNQSFIDFLRSFCCTYSHSFEQKAHLFDVWTISNSTLSHWTVKRIGWRLFAAIVLCDRNLHPMAAI